MKTPDVIEVTASYETWLRAQGPVNEEHLKAKHQAMAESVFGFMRASFYLWSVRWAENCHDLGRDALVVGVGDLHVENFGTWRDTEGRLIWGVNDFDEAAVIPYASDLVRLAVSADLAVEEAKLNVDPESACKAILTGYQHALNGDVGLFVLEEHNDKLRKMALGELREPEPFWDDLAKQPQFKSPPAEPAAIVTEALPQPFEDLRLLQRIAGVGSLGRTRVTGVANHYGSLVAREVKASLSSAWTWAAEKPDADEQRRCAGQLAAAPLRCPDPCLQLRPGWVVRRLAPHSSKVTLDALPDRADQVHLLECMGRETAQLHLATPDATKAIHADLTARPATWLHDASHTMGKSTRTDWQNWKNR